MAIFTTEALEFLRTHHGIATAAELQRCGMSSPAVRSLIESGNLAAVLKGVYRIPAVTLDEAARCAAVCAAHPTLAISGPTAGRLWGLRRLPRDHRIHVLAPPASHPSIAPWVVAYRTAAVHPCDVVQRPDGINVTSRARTALDLARFVPPTDLLSIIEQVIRDGDLHEDELRCGCCRLDVVPATMDPAVPRAARQPVAWRCSGVARRSCARRCARRGRPCGSRAPVPHRSARLRSGSVRSGRSCCETGHRSRSAPHPPRDSGSPATGRGPRCSGRQDRLDRRACRRGRLRRRPSCDRRADRPTRCIARQHAMSLRVDRSRGNSSRSAAPPKR